MLDDDCSTDRPIDLVESLDEPAGPTIARLQ
jgi:hypothetical protein